MFIVSNNKNKPPAMNMSSQIALVLRIINIVIKCVKNFLKLKNNTSEYSYFNSHSAIYAKVIIFNALASAASKSPLKGQNKPPAKPAVLTISHWTMMLQPQYITTFYYSILAKSGT